MLRPLAPPASRTAAPRAVTARRASAQLASEGITRALYTNRRGSTSRGTDVRYQQTYNDWQGWARRYARTLSAAAFQALVVSDLCARCDTRVELRAQAGQPWEPATDAPEWAALMDEYANPLQTSSDLIRLHAWHYQVAGEMLSTSRDDRGALEYGIYSVETAQWDKPDDGLVTIKEVPDGKVTVPNMVSPTDTAFVVPRNQVMRFWLPDQEWQAYATSPMTAGIEDLHRYRALSKYALKVADAAVALTGLMWFPGEAFIDKVAGAEDDLAEAAADAGIPTYALEELYYEIARIRHSDSDDVTSVVPPLFHWSKEYGPPQHVDTGPGLDPEGIGYRTEALEDFSRGTNLPNTTVLGGGVGDANHWSEWLASRQVFDSAVSPVMDRITHTDLTRCFLWPRAVMAQIDPAQLHNVRIGYDPDPVIIKDDNSDNAYRLLISGAINFKAARDAMGFEDTDAMDDPEERAWLLEVLAHGRLATQPAATPGSEPVAVSDTNTQAAPPSTDGTPMTVAAAAAADSSRLPFDQAQAEVGSLALQELTRLRQQLGTALLAQARLVYDDALRQAGARVVNRARSRTGNGRQVQVQQAVAAGAPLRPMLAAVGVKEDELLRHVFDAFRTQAVAQIRLYQQRVAAVFDKVGADVHLPDAADSAADYLVTGLAAMVRARLLDGTQATLAAAAPGMVPRAFRQPSGGDVLPGLPDPDELSRAAARLVRNALDVQEGRSQWQFPGTPDQMPNITAIDSGTRVEEQLTAALDIQPVWTWAHGFYGEPATVLDGHDLLDGFTTNDPSSADTPGDGALANGEAWPGWDWYFPADHDGCSCEWIVDVEGAPDNMVDLSGPDDQELGTQLTQAVQTRDVVAPATADATDSALNDVGGGDNTGTTPRRKRRTSGKK